jgi:hypothetical protein
MRNLAITTSVVEVIEIVLTAIMINDPVTALNVFLSAFSSRICFCSAGPEERRVHTLEESIFLTISALMQMTLLTTIRTRTGTGIASADMKNPLKVMTVPVQFWE